MGRKKLLAVPKTRKIVLSETQKRYAKMIRSIETDRLKTQKGIEAVDKDLAALQAKRTKLDNERQSLEGAKRNLEGRILAQIPPPAAWSQYAKQVYEYHYHYHHCGCGCHPCPHGTYLGPWWWYYGGGGYITYPSHSQLTGQATPCGGIFTWESPWKNVQGGINTITTGKAFSGNLMLGAQGGISGTTITETFPGNSVVFTNTCDLNSGTLAMHSTNVPTSDITLCSASAAGVSFVASFPSGNAVQDAAQKAEESDAASGEAAVTALMAIGFFDDIKPPAVDGADLSVADLAKTVAK